MKSQIKINQPYSKADISPLIFSYLDEAENGWAIGTFGAIGEFIRDKNEKVISNTSSDGTEYYTSRGGIRINHVPESIKVLPYENLSSNSRSWSHGIAFCLPHEEASINCDNSGLKEYGPDENAIRVSDSEGVLFDMGIGAPHIKVCIRTTDNELIEQLRNAEGSNILEKGNSAMHAIVKSSPHRVFISKLGRIEVYQSIPSANGESPEGPHTHVLPKLIKSGRTHAATIPIPDGYVPCLSLFPNHPLMDSLGKERKFIPEAHESFQNILTSYGDQDYVDEKKRITEAVLNHSDPEVFKLSNKREVRVGARIALRQLMQTHPEISELKIWKEKFDHTSSKHRENQEVMSTH